ncbi:MAG: glycoside hydrolase [Eubacterium sp.]|nr:glycoside hydrolase [Eubacterium sp.]
MDFLRAYGTKIVGWLLPEGYMWKLYTKCDRPRRMEKLIEELCGYAYAKDFWKRYFDSYITREDIELIADQGFNSVRLPLNARILFDEDQKSFYQEVIMRVDMLIEWCREFGIYVVLDMHGAPEKRELCCRL